MNNFKKNMSGRPTSGVVATTSPLVANVGRNSLVLNMNKIPLRKYIQYDTEYLNQLKLRQNAFGLHIVSRWNKTKEGNDSKPHSGLVAHLVERRPG